jgi:hypothetical protein
VGVMGAAKSCDQEVGATEVFVEITENAQFPGFGFFQRGELGVRLGQKTGPGEKVPKNCNSEISSWCSVINPPQSRSQNGNPG